MATSTSAAKRTSKADPRVGLVASSGQRSSPKRADRSRFVAYFHADPMERIQIIKQGVSAQEVETLAVQLRWPKDQLSETLGLARATVARKLKEKRPLSVEDGARVLGMARLVGQVQAMVEESGDPKGFDAAAWVADWLERPVPALGGRKPAEFMDTTEGQGLVADLVAQFQSGAYA